MDKLRFTMSARQAGDPRVEPLHFLRQYERTRPAGAFDARNAAQWFRWRFLLREALAKKISLSRIPEGTRRVVEGPVETCRGYTRHGLLIETGRDLWVPAFLLVPSGSDEPRPAILCCHGHGQGMNELVGLTETGRPRRIGTGYQHDFAVQAVRAGFVTLAYDQMGFGRRRDFAFMRKFRVAGGCEQPSKYAMHFGLTMTGLRVWDACRLVDFLRTHARVDPERIGIAGISGGGLVAQFAAGLDDGIRAACVSGYCNRYADSILAIHHCIDNFMPDLGSLADNDDVACLIAPRPLLIQAGTKDPLFPIAATRAAVAKLRRCYALAGRRDGLAVDLFEGGHEFRGRQVWPFFARHLGLPSGK